MDKAELIRRLLATFLVELQDQLRIYTRELLALEREPEGESAKASIAVLFRTVHSLKGASRSVEAMRLSRTCHALEELLMQLRDGHRSVTPELLALLFRAADVLALAGQQLSAAPEVRAHEADSALDALVAQAAQLQQTARSNAPARTQERRSELLSPAAGGEAESNLPEADATARASFVPPAPPAPDLRAPLRQGSSLQMEAAETRSVVRISTRHLDVLLAHAGELAVARRRFEIRRDELEALHESVAHLRTTFRGLRSGRRAPVHSSVGSGLAALPLAAAAEVVDGNMLWQKRALTHTDAGLERIEAELGRLSLALRDDVANLDRAAAPLEAQVHRARMLRFEEACDGLSRVVRDLGQAAQKQVELVVQGGEVELDRAIVDSARLLLLHLVRNAIDHGVEVPEERVSQGKPARARLTIHAAASGERVRIAVRDDGRGLDATMLRAEAQRRGLVAPDDERELFRMIFAPGFSTAKLITEVSGRGVGLDVVRNLVDELGGEIEVTSELGMGTSFNLQLPASASTVRALLLSVGSQVFALPSRNVLRLLRVSPGDLARTQGREVLKVAAGAPVPVAPLRDVLDLPADPQAPTANGKLAVVVVSAESRVAALVVDGWLNEQELVQKPLGKRVRKLRKVSGAALLPTGQIALVLKPNELVQRVHAGAGSGQLAQLRALPTQTKPKRVLLADDSVTTRTLERSILEAAGYEVLTAVDGAQAFSLLQERGADVVVSDVEMPNMDGYALTAAIRSSARFRNLPVVLLTALSSESDKARGRQAGADAYLVKRAFDQQLLLETLRQLT